MYICQNLWHWWWEKLFLSNFYFKIMPYSFLRLCASKQQLWWCLPKKTRDHPHSTSPQFWEILTPILIMCHDFTPPPIVITSFLSDPLPLEEFFLQLFSFWKNYSFSWQKINQVFRNLNCSKHLPRLVVKIM